MIDKIEHLNYYELLEISPTATAREIHKAYERVRKIYDPNSIALYSLFSPEETALMQQRIEEAYRTLVYEDKRRQYDAALREGIASPGTEEPQIPLFEPSEPETAPQPDDVIPPEAAAEPQRVPDRAQLSEEVKPVPEYTGEFTGPAIKTLREQSGRDLRKIADLTRVSVRYLEFIEEENFPKLPARTYIRGFLQLYAKALGCNAERFSSDYLKRYDAAMKPAKTR